MPRRKLSPPDTRGSSEQLSSKMSALEETDTPTVDVGFDQIPDEMHIKIFSYVGHGDKLSVRLVCRRWYKVLSHWSGFNNSVFYLLKLGTDAKVTLRQSKVPWRKLRIEKFRLNEKGYGKLALPVTVTNNISCLEFSKSVISWDAVRKILIQFPAIEELNIIQCKRRRREALTPQSVRLTRGNQIFQGKLESVFRNIKCLNLELRRVSDMTFYLSQFQGSIHSLLVFSVREIFDGIETVTQEATTEFLQVMYNVLYASRRSLKTLQIQLVTRAVVNRFFPEVIARLLNEGLDLVTFDIRHFAAEPDNIRDVRIFAEFIHCQNNLMRLRLPLPGDTPAQVCRNVVLQIPKTIRCVHITHEKYLVPNFLDNFTELCHLETDFEIRSHLLSNKKYPKVYALEMQRGVLSTTVPIISESFPNLVELDINSNSDDIPPIDDRCLQTICQSLKKLRSLVLGACSRITDYGVTGIRREYCERLFKSRSICLEPKLEVPAEEVNGSPLCSIKGLINLMFAGPTSISDVGIYYGFRFRELRYLNIRNNNDISDWGLEWLGKLNCNLEELYLGCGPWVTNVGLNRLRNRLRRIKRRNCVFVWSNQEYYSSDESYAMESGSEDEANNRHNMGFAVILAQRNPLPLPPS
ncbi:unnamed protein product [Allacma fusca]|uniref:F-box domain-containing protein n=1 Tax=Allacma fusca TaxID=39272 RepID=A0A8J2LQZ5_9HEXA|nr:unnamed protein product [Allacma fusca]